MAVTSVRGEMQYKVSFMLSLVFGLIFQSVGFVFVAVILTQFDTLGDWSLWQVGLLYGLRLTSHGLWTVSSSQMMRWDSIIMEGLWDRFLIRPVPLWAQIMFTEVRIPALGDLLSGLAILIAALVNVDIGWSPAKIAFLIISIPGAALIDGAFQVAAASFTFRYLQSMPLRIILDDFQGRFASYPVDIFDRPIRYFLTWIVPMAFMAWVPATVLLDRTDTLPFPGWVAWCSPLIGFTLCYLAIQLFRYQARFYQSSGN